LLSRSRSPSPPTPTPFPYTTLFRSLAAHGWSGLGPSAELLLAHSPPPQADIRASKTVPDIPTPASSIGPWIPSPPLPPLAPAAKDRKSTRLNSSHVAISYAVFCLKQ